MPRGRAAVLGVGCESSLWDPLLPHWLLWMRSRAATLGLRAEVGAPGDMLARRHLEHHPRVRADRLRALLQTQVEERERERLL